MGVVNRYFSNNPKSLEEFAKQLKVERWAEDRIGFTKLSTRQIAMYIFIHDIMPITKHDIEIAKLYLKKIDC